MTILPRRDFVASTIGAIGLTLREAPMNRFGIHGKVIAQPGQRDALVEVLLAAAALVSKAPGCELYFVSISPTEPEAIWVTEVWRSQADHAASLSVEGVKDLIAKGRPLIAGFADRVITTPIGGKGLTPG